MDTSTPPVLPASRSAPARTELLVRSGSHGTPPQGRRAAAVAIRAGLLLLVAALVLLFATDWSAWMGARPDQSTDDATLQADLTPLAAKVAGYVRAVPVRDFQQVRAGDLLVEIDDADYAAEVVQAEANVGVAAASVDNLASQRSLQESNIRAAEAVVAATSATVQRYRLEAARQRALLASGIAGTRQNVEQAEANEKSSTATLEQNEAQAEAARKQLGVLDTQERQLRASLAVQQAALALARIQLGYTRIVSPADGVAGQRLVRPGQYVGVGTQVVAVVPSDLWVIANLKETQMTRVRAGQDATVTVDAFPGLVLRGRVESWSPASGSQFSLLPPDNATGNFTKVVQRIPVKIVLDPAGLRAGVPLRPGMSVVATVHTGATVAP